MADSKARAEAEQVASVAVAGVTGMVLGIATLHNAALAATFPALGAATAQLLTMLVSDKLGRASESYSEGFRRIVGKTLDPDEVGRRAARDPAFRDRIHATLREVEASINIATARALGALAAEYAWPDPPRAPDAFFRGTLRLLRSITAEELTMLQTMCEALGALDVPDNFEGLILVERAGELTWERWDSGKPETQRIPVGPKSQHYLAIFDLLKQGLGRDAAGGFYDMPSGPQVLVLPVENLRGLRKLLGPPSSGTP
jgi:hypothetical protein